MATRKNRLFAKLANGVNTDGDITTAAIAPTITADIENAGTNVYDSAALLPRSGFSAGDTAFIKSTSRLYINSGVGWYSVAVINNTPNITSVVDSDGNTTPFSLATDGTPTTITITATDSDGDPLTYSATPDSDFGGLATVTNDANVFTITPLSQDSATTESGTITFAATDGINISNSGVQTFTLRFLSQYWDEVLLSIGTSSTSGLTNSSFVDRSTNASTVTTSGSPIQTSFHPYLDNWSVEFDGTNDYIQVAHESGFDFSTGDFTVELWANFQQSGITESLVGTYANNGADGWLLQKRDDGTIKWWKGSTEIASGTFTPTLRTWHHIAASRESGTLKLFIDGTQVASVSHTADLTYAQPLTIGRLSHSTAPQWCDNNISNLRIVKGTALYTSAFTPSTEALTNVTGTTFLGLQSNRFINEVNSSSAFTIYDAPKISSFSPFGQGSEYASDQNKGSTYFDGSSNIIVDDESAAGSIYPAGNDWTISCWFYNTGSTGFGSLFTWGASGVYAPMNIYADMTNLKLNAPLSSTGSSWDIAPDANVTGSDWVRNAWNHVEFCRSGNDFHLFLNGSLIRTVTSSNELMTPTQDITIGKRPTDTPFTGYIADMQYILGTALHTSSFTPPTSPVTHANSAMYLPMDNIGIFDKTSNITDLVLYGNTLTSNTQTKFSDTSIYIDTGGDYITSYDIPPILASSQWTIEMWIYPTGYATGDRFLAFNTTGGGNTLLFGLENSYESSNYTYSEAFATNEWAHFAVTHDPTSGYKVYKNGTLVLTRASTFNLTGNIFAIGAEFDGANGGSPGNYQEGYYENIQVYRGIKYTTNFTPPTTTQGRTYQVVS